MHMTILETDDTIDEIESTATADVVIVERPPASQTVLAPTSTNLIIVSSGGGGGASSVSQLTDVDLTDLTDGDTLVWDAASGFWKPSMTPDQRNFRGDWQDPSAALLWSTDFSDPGDFDLFTSTVIGSTPTGRSIASLAMSGSPSSSRPDFDTGAFLHTQYSSGSLPAGVAYMFNSDNPDSPLLGMAPTKASVWQCSSPSNSALRVGLFRSPAYADGAFTTGLTVWQKLTLTGLSDSFGFGSYQSVTSGGTTTRDSWFTGLEVYGSPSESDLYQINDVVTHSGYYWRSLYNNNTDEPSDTSLKWLQIAGI